MTETFRAVEPLQMPDGHTLVRQLSSGEVKLTPYSLTVAEARALHRWLTAALPCEHQYSPTRDRGERCIKCGAMLP